MTENQRKRETICRAMKQVGSRRTTECASLHANTYATSVIAKDNGLLYKWMRLSLDLHRARTIGNIFRFSIQPSIEIA